MIITSPERLGQKGWITIFCEGRCCVRRRKICSNDYDTSTSFNRRFLLMEINKGKPKFMSYLLRVALSTHCELLRKVITNHHLILPKSRPIIQARISYIDKAKITQYLRCGASKICAVTITRIQTP